MQSKNLTSREIISNVHQLLFVNADAPAAINYLSRVIEDNQVDDPLVIGWLALSHIENLDLEKAKDVYLANNLYYQAGFCDFLQGNVDQAKRLWQSSPDSEAKHWGLGLHAMCRGFIDYMFYKPTYLGIRNHLEADLGYFIRFQQIKFVNSVISVAPELVDINPETFKFIGRALYNNGRIHESVNFLMEAQKILPNDPEIYYQLGRYSMSVNANDEAKTMFNHCLMLSPFYTPAKDRLSEL